MFRAWVLIHIFRNVLEAIEKLKFKTVVLLHIDLIYEIRSLSRVLSPCFLQRVLKLLLLLNEWLRFLLIDNLIKCFSVVFLFLIFESEHIISRWLPWLFLILVFENNIKLNLSLGIRIRAGIFGELFLLQANSRRVGRVRSFLVLFVLLEIVVE